MPAKAIDEVLEFWNRRASLKAAAGSNDLIAKQLEIEAIYGHVREGMKLIEIGCGNGITAIELARRLKVSITAFDFARNMIEEAKRLAKVEKLLGRVSFRVGDVRKLPQLNGSFDLAYTERVLINLPDWPQQKQAIANIGKLLAPGGVYVMCENSQDGLENVNALRKDVGLAAISPPWHNRYLRDAEVAACRIPGLRLQAIEYFSSTYYLLSRVVNAWLAAQESKEPQYDAPVNQLALKLPSIGEFGQGRIWLWRKTGKARGAPSK